MTYERLEPEPPNSVAVCSSDDEVGARYETAFREFVQRPDFPCLGAKSVVRVNTYVLRTYGALGRASNASKLLLDLVRFNAEHGEAALSAFVAVFPDSPPADEISFERRLWQQLQLIHESDRSDTRWAEGVSADPDDAHFSFSAAGRAYFIVGLHPVSSRIARRFSVPALVFNPHEQFERLREEGRFEGLRSAIRARDVSLQGTENPNLADFGEHSEARQYSGRRTEPDWKCPFHRKR